jgi:hypothetical protein
MMIMSAAAAGAPMLWCLRLIGVGVGRFDGINRSHWQREQVAGARDVVGALAAGEQAKLSGAGESGPSHPSLSTQVRAWRGRTVIPGLIDSPHIHVIDPGTTYSAELS